MAVTEIDSTTTGATAFTSSRAPAVPTGAGSVLLNDVAVVRVSRWESVNPAFTNISGFTQRAQAVNGSGKIDTFIKRMAGGETGTWTFAWTGSMWTTGHAILYRGVDPAADLTSNTVCPLISATNSGTAWPAVTLNSLPDGVLDWHGYSESGGTHTPPTNWTEIEDDDSDISAFRIVTAGSFTTSGGASSVSSPNIASMLFLPAASGAVVTSVPLLDPVRRMLPYLVR